MMLTNAVAPLTMSAVIDNPLYLMIGVDDPEDVAVEAIEDLRATGDRGARVTLRLPVRLAAYIESLAKSNDRSFAAEVVAALQAHEALSRLAAVLDTELQERRKRESGGVHGVTGETAAKFVAMQREDLGRIWAAAFQHGQTTHQRDYAGRLLADG
jgi:hypothetical protein